MKHIIITGLPQSGTFNLAGRLAIMLGATEATAVTTNIETVWQGIAPITKDTRCIIVEDINQSKRKHLVIDLLREPEYLYNVKLIPRVCLPDVTIIYIFQSEKLLKIIGKNHRRFTHLHCEVRQNLNKCAGEWWFTSEGCEAAFEKMLIQQFPINGSNHFRYDDGLPF